MNTRLICFISIWSITAISLLFNGTSFYHGIIVVFGDNLNNSNNKILDKTINFKVVEKFQISEDKRVSMISDAISNILYDHDNPMNIINNNNNSIPKDSNFWKDISLLIDSICQYEYNPECNNLQQLPFYKAWYNGNDPFIQ